MKNFTQQKWLECLAGKQWEDLGRTEDINEMAEDFNKKIKEALDACAPWKNVKIRQYYKSGISEETKQLIRQRDDLRKSIHKSPNEKKCFMNNIKNYATELQTKSEETLKITMWKKWIKLVMKRKSGRW